MHTDLPDMKLQLKAIEQLVSFKNATDVFGHSLGAVLGLRLAEKHMLNKLFLIAGWDYDDLTLGHKLFWKTKIDHTKIK